MHLLEEATAAINAALKTVSHVDPAFMPPLEAASVMRNLVAVETGAAELRMRVMATTGAAVAELEGFRDVAAWLAATTQCDVATPLPTCGWRPRSTGGWDCWPAHCARGG